ncbi:MAG: ferritin family protein [Candidatus Omnitrophota bacterium]|nr:ferritin family protein [Candidatus Omnitrophota bacterium]
MKIDYLEGKIRITDFNSIEAYKIARKIESEGIEFYGKLLKQNFDEATNEIMKFLLLEEKAHLKLFEEKLLEAKQNLDDGFEEDSIFDYVDTKVFYPFNAVASLNEALTNKEKAIRLGVKIENNSISFYEACLLNTKEQQTKKDLRWLIGEENKHLLKLQGLLKK